MSARARLLVMLVLALIAAGTAVATGQKSGQHAHKATASTPAKTIPKTPPAQTIAPPVRTQTVPVNPRPLGNVPAINDARDRRRLEAFIAQRPVLGPWKELIWYAAHYSYSNVSARGLAGLIWCIDFRVAACNRVEDAKLRRLLNHRLRLRKGSHRLEATPPAR